LNGLILAGGASRRMQRDKAYIAYDGVPQLQRAYRLVMPFVDSCFISVRDSQRDDPLRAQFPLIVDRLQDCGPAAGILAALEQDPLASWLVVACDLPLLDEATLATLVSSRFKEGDATAYVSDADGQPEPLCAIWEASSHAALLACVTHDNGSLRKALIHLRTRLLPAGGSNTLLNTNTPDEVTSLLHQPLKP
jgi:molybdopterin-guanine dinucleotide biosynthesis protein A